MPLYNMYPIVGITKVKLGKDLRATQARDYLIN
jgi:hypothetical protein